MTEPTNERRANLVDFGNWEQLERALHGDLRPLVALLRSDEPLSRALRDYLADEIEREPDKRFRRQRREDLNVRENDRTLLYRVYSAKVELAILKFGPDVDDDAVFEAQDSISDADALRFLSERYGFEVDDEDLKNALRRMRPGIFDPRGPRRRLRKIKKGYPDPGLLDILRSNLRGPKDVPIRAIVAANPGGVGHYWLAKRYVFKTAPWETFDEEKSGCKWVYAPSTFAGNQFIDREQYADQLRSSCPDDKELLKAWVDGDWAIARGAFFASVLDEGRNAVDPWQAIPHGWKTYLTHDWGSTAPSATYIVAVSPGGYGPDERFYPRDSLVLVDELATCKPDRPSEGIGWTVPIVAEEILAMCERWGVKARGVADDACFSKGGHASGSIADEFLRERVYFTPARKADRMTGWTIMRRLLADAGKPDVPGLYVSRACEYFWSTVPYLARDPKRVEDVDSSGPDHAADAVRYGCLKRDDRVQRVQIIGA